MQSADSVFVSNLNIAETSLYKQDIYEHYEQSRNLFASTSLYNTLYDIYECRHNVSRSVHRLRHVPYTATPVSPRRRQSLGRPAVLSTNNRKGSSSTLCSTNYIRTTVDTCMYVGICIHVRSVSCHHQIMQGTAPKSHPLRDAFHRHLFFSLNVRKSASIRLDQCRSPCLQHLQVCLHDHH